ncbi:hypothetical protein ONZ45_g883 [Pleurotus djamor]|nr:hypothetical protein ONZ45_g883 [Pleurotus djamor]
MTLLNSRTIALSRTAIQNLSRGRVPPALNKFLHASRIAAESRCPSCNQLLATPLPACTHCWHISAVPPSASYHGILGLQDTSNPFAIDTAALKRNFRRAQTAKQDLAQALSSFVNEAYQRLLRPLTRAEYILETNNHPLTEDDKLEDLFFVSEVMEAREAIETAQTREDVEAVQKLNHARINDTVKEIELLVAERNWLMLKEATIRLKYLNGIDRAAQDYLHAHP